MVSIFRNVNELSVIKNSRNAFRDNITKVFKFSKSQSIATQMEKTRASRQMKNKDQGLWVVCVNGNAHLDIRRTIRVVFSELA